MTVLGSDPVFRPVGDAAIRVSFGGGEAGPAVRAWCARLSAVEVPGVIEWVPAYTTVTVHYRPLEIGFEDLVDRLRALPPTVEARTADTVRLLVLPVRYGGERGPDLPFVSATAGLTEAEVIARHCAPLYRVEMIGFSPGFPYLSGMDPALAAPRLERPRMLVPAGSVGIAGTQTGVYSIATPGGWRILGRTPVKLFDPTADPVSLLAAGDGLRFRSVDEETFREIERGVAAGTYHPEWLEADP